MPQITYLLVHRLAHKIRGVRTTHDISDVKALFDHAAAASCDLMGLDSVEDVHVDIYELIKPAGDFRGRSVDNIASQLGEIDQRFMATDVFRLFPSDILQLDADGFHG